MGPRFRGDDDGARMTSGVRGRRMVCGDDGWCAGTTDDECMHSVVRSLPTDSDPGSGLSQRLKRQDARASQDPQLWGSLR